MKPTLLAGAAAREDRGVTATDAVISELADDLWGAEHSCKPVSPLTERYPDLDISDAYAIQKRNIDRHIAGGARVCGRKIGLTSKPMQKILDVSEPDYGVLLDHMFVEDGDEIDLDKMLQPRVEAELAFIMGENLAGPGITAARAMTAIAGVMPAIEVVDSRVADWKIKLVDTVSDNASSGLLVVGGRPRPVNGDFDLRTLGVTIYKNGELIDTGAGAACLGNPARCVAWLANTYGAQGESLKAGDIVLPGAVHAMQPVSRGDVFRADFAHLGMVTIPFSS